MASTRTLLPALAAPLCFLLAAGAVPERPGAPRPLAPGDTLQLGDSIRDSLTAVGDADTFSVSLAAGDTVDVAVLPWGDPALPRKKITLLAPDGSLLDTSSLGFQTGAGSSELLVAASIQESGTHTVVVEGDCPGCSAINVTGSYQLQIRSAGAILGFAGSVDVHGSHGAVVEDTLWLFNQGARSGQWWVTDTLDFLTVTPGDGALDPAADTGSPPPGAIPLVVSLDLAAVEEGRRSLHHALRFNVDEGWGGAAYRSVRYTASDPALTVLVDSLPLHQPFVTRHPDGDLVAVGYPGDRLLRLDPETGATTEWTTLSTGCAVGVHVDGAGSAYLADPCDGVVHRIAPGGTVDTVAQGVGPVEDVATGADGTVYWVDRNDGLWRQHPDSAPVQMADIGNGSHYAVAVGPSDGLVHFTRQNELFRIQPGGGDPELVAALEPGSTILDLEVGASGRWYLLEGFNGLVRVLDASFAPLDRIGLTGASFGLALTDGALLASASDGTLARVPVEDAPAEAGGTFVVVEGDSEGEVHPQNAAEDTVEVRGSDGRSVGVRATWNAPWLEVEPDTLTTPGAMVLRYDPTGLADGSYTDTLRLHSDSVDTSPALRLVRLEVASDLLVVGDTVEGVIEDANDADTFRIRLEAGDTVDFKAFPDSVDPLGGSTFQISGGDPVGSMEHDAGDHHTAIAPGMVVGSSGEYGIVVHPRGGDTGRYLLTARRSGPVLSTDPSVGGDWIGGAAGSVVSDTVRVRNAGARAGSFTVQSTVPWLTVEEGGGPLPAPDAEAAVVLSADLGQLPEGVSEIQDVLRLETDDGWMGPSYLATEVWVHDPEVELLYLDEATGTGPLAAHPDGDIAAVVDGEEALVRIDPVTGAATPWAALEVGCTYGMHVTEAGSAYLTDYCDGTILRVDPAGTVTEVLSGLDNPWGITALPDGTLYFTQYHTGLWKLEPGSTDPAHIFQVSSQNHTAVRYDPERDRIYVMYGHHLYSVDPGTEEEEHLGALGLLDLPVFDLHRGASGRWYVGRSHGVGVFSWEMTEEDYIGWPLSGGPFTLLEEGIYGGLFGCTDPGVCDRPGIYRVPVDDGPIVPPWTRPLQAWMPTLAGMAGDTVTTPLFVELDGHDGGLDAYQAEVRFDPSTVELLGIGAGGLPGVFESRLDSAAAGVVRFGTSGAGGAGADTTVLAELSFLLAGPPGSRAELELALTGLWGPGTQDLLGSVGLTSGALSVGLGYWGDPTLDELVTAHDALVCLSHAVGLDLGGTGYRAVACDVAPDAGSAFDGTVNALDALAVLTEVVGLPLPEEFRVGRIR